MNDENSRARFMNVRVKRTAACWTPRTLRRLIRVVKRVRDGELRASAGQAFANAIPRGVVSPRRCLALLKPIRPLQNRRRIRPTSQAAVAQPAPVKKPTQNQTPIW